MNAPSHESPPQIPEGDLTPVPECLRRPGRGVHVVGRKNESIACFLPVSGLRPRRSSLPQLKAYIARAVDRAVSFRLESAGVFAHSELGVGLLQNLLRRQRSRFSRSRNLVPLEIEIHQSFAIIQNHRPRASSKSLLPRTIAPATERTGHRTVAEPLSSIDSISQCSAVALLDDTSDIASGNRQHNA